MIDVTARAVDGAPGVNDVEAGSPFRTALAVFAFAATLAYGASDVFARPAQDVVVAAAGGGGSVGSVQPDVGAATWAGLALSVATPRTMLPGVGQGAWVGIAPTVVTPRVVLPSVGVAAFAGLAATVQTPRNVLPGVGAAVVAGLAPTVVGGTGAGASVEPGTGVVVATGYAPAVATGGAPPPGGGGGGYAAFPRLAPKYQPKRRPREPTLVAVGTGVVSFTGYAPAVWVAESEWTQETNDMIDDWALQEA